MNQQQETKAFHIGTVLSITDGKLVSLDHVGGIYDILNFMTGDSLMTHQLPRAMDECRPFLVEQHPGIAAEKVPDGLTTMEAVEAYLAGLYPKHGESVEVAPLPPEAHTRIDPITEMRMNHPNVQVITVAAPEEDA